jgi:soluble cytochrome b562
LELVKEYGIEAETAGELVDGWAEEQRALGVELTQGESKVLGWARAAEQAAEDAERAGWEARYAASGIEEAGDEAEETTTEVAELEDAFAGLREEMSDRSAFLSIQDDFDTIAVKGAEAMQAAADGSEDAASKAREYEQAQIDLKGSVLDYSEAVGDIPEDQVTDILALIDEGSITEAERRLASLERVRNVRVQVQTAGTSTYVPSGSGGGGYSHVGSRFAAGETKQVVPGQVFTPDVPGRMASVEESRRMLSGQSTGGTMQPLIINLAGERQVKGWIDQRDAQALAEFEAGAR